MSDSRYPNTPNEAAAADADAVLAVYRESVQATVAVEFASTPKAAVIKHARDRGVHVPASATKATAIEAIAESRVRESDAWSAHQAAADAAHKEAAVGMLVDNATRKHEAAVDHAGRVMDRYAAGAASPDLVMDAVVSAERARVVAAMWRRVDGKAREGAAPMDAAAEVAAVEMGRVVREASYGPVRSSSPSTNHVESVQRAAVAEFVRDVDGLVSLPVAVEYRR